ncbi:signal peptidase I [Patescibacteria group bacterium]|nr:signal peptidase I [Patescibacteria group bacterium]
MYNIDGENNEEYTEEYARETSRVSSFLGFAWEVIKVIIIAAVIVIPIRYFLFQPFFVRGQSMDPNFANGDYLIIDEITYRFRGPERGEVIVFRYPQDPSNRFIKRVIGLPGEEIKIKDGEITIGGDDILDEKYLPDDLTTSGDVHIILEFNEYFVLGDNRPYSFDSRRFGPLSKEYIIGRVYLRAWPFDSISKFGAPAY